MEHAITIEQVSITYKGKNYCHNALEQLSLAIPQKQIFGFLGPNGAGKTTTIKAILNLIPAQQGKISILGKSNTSHKTRSNIGYMPEIANYYWYLTPKELLLMYAEIFDIHKADALKKIDALLELVDLRKQANTLMKHLSKGMLQKVSFAQALINDPALLILDEPTSGLDPVARMNMRNIIRSLKDQGKTIFFSSHELSEIELICDSIAILNQGKLIRISSVKEILEKSKGHSIEKYFFDLISGDTQ
ncbi:MAG: ABC transporter ATP-binding protein [Candidatus Omnitrophica bacterium]|nr:ABC transporter ATP-binding protein [Candidatus Omnitrophota bacterium]